MKKAVVITSEIYLIFLRSPKLQARCLTLPFQGPRATTRLEVHQAPRCERREDVRLPPHNVVCTQYARLRRIALFCVFLLIAGISHFSVAPYAASK